MQRVGGVAGKTITNHVCTDFAGAFLYYAFVSQSEEEAKM